MWEDGGERKAEEEGTFSRSLSLSLLFGSLDLRGLEVPKSSKGRGWSRSKSSRAAGGTAMRLRGERDAREGTAARAGDERSVTLTHSILAVLGVSRTNAAAAAAAVTLVYSFSCMDPVMDASAGLDSGGDGDYLGCV